MEISLPENHGQLARCGKSREVIALGKFDAADYLEIFGD